MTVPNKLLETWRFQVLKSELEANNHNCCNMSADVPPEYRTPEALRTLANFLRGSNGVKVKSGIEHEKRVDYFKGADFMLERSLNLFPFYFALFTTGKRLLECIIEAKKWPKSIPRITDEAVAVKVSDLLIDAQFFHRSEKVKEKKGYLKVKMHLLRFSSSIIHTLHRFHKRIFSKKKVTTLGCMLVI